MTVARAQHPRLQWHECKLPIAMPFDGVCAGHMIENETGNVRAADFTITVVSACEQHTRAAWCSLHIKGASPLSAADIVGDHPQ